MDDNTTAPFELTQVWPQISEQDGEDLLAFWKAHKAIPNDDEARRRLSQVVLLARDRDGAIAGVCTAYAVTPPQLGQPMYFWRVFIAPVWRSSRLFATLMLRSCSVLEVYARKHDYPCIGILVELENERFNKVGRKAEWPSFRLTYIGKSPRGLDVRAHYFKGARLK